MSRRTNPSPQNGPAARDSHAATLFMAFLALVALVLIGYFAFAGRSAGDSADDAAITIEGPGTAPVAPARVAPR